MLRGVGLAGDLPVMLRGATRSFVSITGPSGFVYPAWLRSDRIGQPYDAALLAAQFGASVSSPSADAASGRPPPPPQRWAVTRFRKMGSPRLFA